MLYKCGICSREFDFKDAIEFCPYCGKSLSSFASFSADYTEEAILAQRIDAIWGDEARIRKEFSSVISECIRLINQYADRSIAELFSNRDIAQYEKNYSGIKQSNNRKTLITRIDHFLDSLDTAIDEISNSVPANMIKKLECAHGNVEALINELYDFLGLYYAPPKADVSPDSSYYSHVLYSKEQLRHLYQLVLTAYSKYKRCVADNNMFAAFASTSNYGMMTDSWYRWLNRLSVDREEAEQKNPPQIDEVIEYLKQKNTIKYLGLLDEDFVPHVDTFWYGLEMLCEFINDCIVIKGNIKSPGIDSDTHQRLLRSIASSNFAVNEKRLEAAIDLKERFEQYNTKNQCI